MIRWNAMAMVVRANRKPGELGGHIRQLRVLGDAVRRSASTTSGARPGKSSGDLLYIQGHSSPGIYARAFLEGRIPQSQLDNFRMEGRRPRHQQLPASPG